MFQTQQSGLSSYDHPYDIRILNRLKSKKKLLNPIKLNAKKVRKSQNVSQLKLQKEKTMYFPQNFNPQIQNRKQQLKKSFYFKLKVISKVGTFIEKLKRNITFSKPQFKYNQMLYIQNSNQTHQDQFLLETQNIFVIAFQIIVLILAIINIWSSTLGLVFPSVSILPQTFIIISILIFLIEIIINFNCQIYDNDKLQIVNKKKQIAKIYMNIFWYDLIGLVGLVLCMQNINPMIGYGFKLMVIAKYKSILRIKQKMQNIFSTSAQMEALLGIISLLFNIFTFIHILSLLFNFTSQLQHNRGIQITWIQRNQLKYTNPFELYIYGWYWGSTILTTVGFGDIVPGNIYESFMISFVQVLCCAIFGYCINYIGSLIGVLGQSRKIYQKELRKLNKYLKNININNKCKNKIRSHFFYNHKMKELYDPQAEQTLLNSIPEPIKDQLILANNTDILKKTNFFSRYNQTIIKKLARKLKKVTYAPEEYVFNKHQANIKMWIIEKGTICDYYNNSPSNDQKKLTIYGIQSPVVGLINFITGQPYYTYARTKQFTFAYELSRKDFVQIIKNYKSQYTKFCQMKDEMIFKGKKYSNRCLACMKLSHNTVECPKIHYTSPGAIISKDKQKRNALKLQRRYVYRKQERINSRLINHLLCEQDNDNIFVVQEENNNQMQFQGNNNERGSMKKISMFFNRKSNNFSTKFINDGNIGENMTPVKQGQKNEQKNEQNFGNEIRMYFEKIQTINNEGYFPKSYYKQILCKYKQYLNQIHS